MKKILVDEIKKHENLVEYHAGQPEKIFQKWIIKNIKWIFGVNYLADPKHDVKKISINSEADIVMESMDGFIDLIELKRPKYELFKFDESHNSYYPSPDLSKAIGQCIYYLKEIEEYKIHLEKKHKVRILKPRIMLIAGRTKNFSTDQYEAMRMLNQSLNSISIIAYEYLLKCGSQMIKLQKL